MHRVLRDTAESSRADGVDAERERTETTSAFEQRDGRLRGANQEAERPPPDVITRTLQALPQPAALA